mgnify:CR=1 FL=1
MNFSYSKFFTLFFIVVFQMSLKSQSAFIENQGQWDNNILFKSDFHSGKLYIENAALNYNFYDLEDVSKHIDEHHKVQHYHTALDRVIKAHCLKMKLNNASFENGISTNKKISEYFNYYLGNNPEKWASKVPAFNEIAYKEVYNGINFKLNSNENGYKYDFIVKPNADVAQINISYLGAEELSIKNENLYVKTSVNEIIELKPYAYQIINEEKYEVKCAFEIVNEKVRFYFPESYNKDETLIIDPFIVFSRYSGSFADNFGYTATYDSEENAYGAGSVFGIGYITTPGAFDISFNGANTDIGIVKYSDDGLQRIFSTYLGGSATDLPHSLVVNSRDELYLLGTTSSPNFPIDTFSTAVSEIFFGGPSITFPGLAVAYDNGSDLVVARFSPTGTNLISSTFLGGTGNDGLNASTFLKYNYADEIRGEILIDEDDNCFVVSCTESTDFPHTNPFQTANAGGLDALIIKMDENLTNILWSSYLGGQSDDAAYSLDFDSDYNLVLAGGTHSNDFPVSNAFEGNFAGGSSDGFITRIHNSGSGLFSSTYYGSSSYDQIYFVELNDLDEVHIFGQTIAPADELISNAIYNKANGGQMLAKFNPTVDTLIWATRFGDESGIPDISPTAFLVDVCNRVFLSGWGWGTDAQLSGTSGLDVTADAVDNTTDNQDFYFMVLQDDASSLLYASFFGGQFSREHVDGGTSRFDKKGIVYQAVCAGCGGNQDFPTVPTDSIGDWSNNSPNCNLGVVKYAFSPPSVIADFSIPPTDCAPLTVNFINQSQTAFNDTSQAEFLWIIDSDTFNTYDLDYTFNISGVYEIMLLAIDTQSCNFMDSVSKQLTIIGNGFSTLDDAALCTGSSVQIGITPSSNSNITYNWTPDYFLSNTNIANPFSSTPVDTTYQLILSNGNCTDTLVQSVKLESIAIDIEPFDSICLETNIDLRATGIPGALYVWSPEEVVVAGQGNSIATIYAANSQQTVSVFVTTAEACTAIETVNLLTIDDLPDLEVFADPDSLETGQNSQLLAVSDEAITYLWDTTSNFTTLEIENPLAENITETTTFNVRVHNGTCPKRDSVTVYVVIPDCLEGKFYVPNAFSPNSDGNNDVFKVRTTLVNIENFYFAVYDRWGNKVFETNDKTQGWDGTFKGEAMTPNVYGWYCEGVCPNGEDYFLKGNVTLLK